MISFKSFLTEAKKRFPVEVKEVEPNVYHAFHKGTKVGQLAVWKDLEHGKDSAFKVAVHPKYQRRGVATAMYDHVEKTKGQTLHPASALSDDGHAFWAKRRPAAVANDLRNHRDKLLGKDVTHHDGKTTGTIVRVGSGAVIAKKHNHPELANSEFPLKRDDLKKQGHL